MSGLIRAEWYRLRRRGDLWIILLLLTGLAVLAYLSGLSSLENAYAMMRDDQSMPADFLEQIAEQHRNELMQYAFPASVGLVLENGQLLLLALVAYVGVATTGAEFAYGTIRTSLVAHGNRVGYVLVRLGAVSAFAVLLLAVHIMLGAILPAVASLLGHDLLPAEASRGALEIAALVGILLLAATAIIGLATAWTLVMRSAAIALVLTLAFVFVDGALHGLILEATGGSQDVLAAWLLPASSFQLLFSRLHDPSMAGTVPAAVPIAAAIGWTILGWLGSVLILARADIRE